MSKLMNSRLGLASIVASVAVGLFLLVGTTYAVLVCETVGTTTEGEEEEDPENPPGEMADCGSNSATVKRYLLDAGYSNDAAAGIMGNLAHESGYTPNKLNQGKNTQTCLVNDSFKLYENGVRTPIADRYTTKYGVCTIKASGAFGLAQWLGAKIEKGLQDTADSMGLPVTSLKAQATFLVKQLNTKLFGNYYYQYFNKDNLNKHTLQEVTYAFYRYVEAPGSATCVGVNGDGKNKGCGDKKVINKKLPPFMFNVNTLLAHKEDYELAYNSFTGRYETAKNAAALDVSNCHLGEDPGDPSDPSSPTDPDPVPVVPTSSSDPPTASGSGALGAQSASGMIGQYDNGVKGLVWRKDGSTISASGCSLVAVVNAAKATGHSSVSASSLAGWSKSNISSASWDNLKKMASHVGLSTGSWLWSSKSTSDSEKLSKIRSVLASGGVVIAGGDRSGTNFSCEDASNRDSGKCVFTPGGHFVAIIGITADDKLVVANPARASNRTWIFPASGLLRYSNKAVMAK